MVHTFKQNGFNIALDAPSGAVHLLSDCAFDIVSLISPPLDEKCPAYLLTTLSYSRRTIRECYDEIYQLYKDETLFSPDWDDKPELRTYAQAPTVIKSLCLHISHDCNMRCKYCFASSGSYDRERLLMSYETGKKALDFLLEKSGAIKNLEVDFFGGEPLLNFDTVKRLVAYGREREAVLGKNIRFTITTNGSLLDDDSIAFINENMSNAVLSIDGRREVNDSMRTFEDGTGTYDVIIDKFRRLTATRKTDWYVRGTYTRLNLDFAADVLHLCDAGFNQISVEPVVLDEGDALAIHEDDLPVIFAEYDKLTDAMIERIKENRPFTFFHFMIDLEAGPCVYKRVKGCGSGSEYIAITPDGDIFPCHQFAGLPEFKMGNINDGSFNRDIQHKFAGNNIMTMSHCRSCWAKYFCGGGCAANSFKYQHRLDGQYKIGCELERKRVECALAIKAAEAQLSDDE